LGIF